jgi:hypothetical protein
MTHLPRAPASLADSGSGGDRLFVGWILWTVPTVDLLEYFHATNDNGPVRGAVFGA